MNENLKNSKTVCFHMGHSDLECLNFLLMTIIEIIENHSKKVRLNLITYL